MANENSNIIPVKDFNHYIGGRNDYANGQELMVKITLAEYRDLVSDQAMANDAQQKLRMKKMKLEKQIKELKEQIVALKATITVSIKQED